MTVRWMDTMTPQLRRIAEQAIDLSEDVEAGAQVVLEASQALVPKRSGDLAASGRIDKGRGGTNTVGIVYDSVYARWIHEHLYFKHPFGGRAKYLEVPLRTKARSAMKRAGEHFWGRL